MDNQTKTCAVEPRKLISQELKDIINTQRETDMILKTIKSFITGNREEDLEIIEPTCFIDSIEKIKKLATNNISLANEIREYLE